MNFNRIYYLTELSYRNFLSRIKLYLLKFWNLWAMVCNDEISQFCANSWRHDYPRREVPSTRSVLIFPGWPLFRDRYDRRRYSHESSYLWCSRLARETPAVTFETATRKRLLRYCHVIERRYHKPCRMSNFIASRLPLFWMRCPTYFAFLSIYIYV